MRLPTKKKIDNASKKKEKEKVNKFEIEWKKLLCNDYTSWRESNLNELEVTIKVLTCGMIRTCDLVAIVIDGNEIETPNSWYDVMLALSEENKDGVHKQFGSSLSGITQSAIRSERVPSRDKTFLYKGMYVTVSSNYAIWLENIAKMMVQLDIGEKQIQFKLRRKEYIEEKGFWGETKDEITEQEEQAALIRMQIKESQE